MSNIDSIAIQHGGDHYKNRGIQPVEYIHSNELNFFEGNIIKYTTRHRSKNGKEDLKKAIHYLQMLLEFEYAVSSEVSFRDKNKTLGELRD